MTEYDPPEDAESPEEPHADEEATSTPDASGSQTHESETETAERYTSEVEGVDPHLTDDELLAAAEAPYELPVDAEPTVTDESAPYQAADTPFDPPHQPPPHQPPPYQPPPAAAPRAPGQHRRLFRSRNDRKIGGVAGGLARYLGVDPTVVRIAFVVLALTGTSILVYLAAWVLIPEHPAGQPEPVWRERATDRNLAIAVGLASLGLAVAILNESWLVLAIVLIAGGIWLLSEQPLSTRSDWVSPVPPPPGDATSSSDFGAAEPVYAAAAAATATTATGDATPSGGWGWDSPAPPRSGDAIAPVPAPTQRRGPQRITRLVLSLLALLAAFGIAASAGDWWDVSGTRMLGIAIVTIGAGVVVGAITKGGARGLIPLGILAVLLLIPVTAVDGLVDDGVGSTTVRPLSVDALQSEYRHGVGEYTIDLSRIDLDGLTRNVNVDVGIGELTLILPDGVGGTLDVESKAGELIVNLPGSGSDLSVEGINQTPSSIRLPGDRGELILDVEVGLGVVDIRGN